jgi:MFS transporter, UMF1 family
LTHQPKDDPKNIFGWCMYDWANSAYILTVAVGVLPSYFAGVVVGADGLRIGGIETSATAVWAFTVSIASFIAFMFAPVLGAIADFSATKKRFLLVFAYAGALFTTLLYFCGSGDIYLTLLLFLLAQIAFIASLVFYDSFITDIVSPERMDWISGKGYSYGYVGGGLQFAFALALVAGHDYLGISQATAARISILTAGLWWAGFALVTVKYLREPRPALTQPSPGGRGIFEYIGIGFSRTLQTTLKVRQFRHLVLFLLAFMLYNDGIQTVIDMASIYGAEELRLSTTTLMVTLLVVQIIAAVGALLFSWIAAKIGSKKAIMISLVLWSGVVMYAYFIETAAEFFGLGVVIGIVLGGSQALSRSFYGSMVPEEASAEFFGFYTIFTRFSAIWGPATFGLVRQAVGSSRLAILSLIFFFVAGLILMAFVDVKKAREAKESGLFDSRYSQA